MDDGHDWDLSSDATERKQEVPSFMMDRILKSVEWLLEWGFAGKGESKFTRVCQTLTRMVEWHREMEKESLWERTCTDD